jgi:hypothetical protein
LEGNVLWDRVTEDKGCSLPSTTSLFYSYMMTTFALGVIELSLPDA